MGRLVATHRAALGLTQAELATRSELSRTILSRIEQGDGNPSIGTLWRISRALRVPLGELLVEPAAPQARVIRAGEGATMGDPSGMVGRLVHSGRAEQRSELYALELPAGARRESAPHLSGVEEVIFVAEGDAMVGPDGAAHTLAQGDAIWFAADVPHRYEAVDAPCRLLCWMLYPGSAAGASGAAGSAAPAAGAAGKVARAAGPDGGAG